MRNQPCILKIEVWDEGTNFEPTFHRKHRNSNNHGHSTSSESNAISAGSLKPVGYCVTYSYTLFRKGEGQHDSLYRFY
jgi:hypothetical protein